MPRIVCCCGDEFFDFEVFKKHIGGPKHSDVHGNPLTVHWETYPYTEDEILKEAIRNLINYR